MNFPLNVVHRGAPRRRFLLFVRTGNFVPEFLMGYDALYDVTVVLSIHSESIPECDSDFWILTGGRSKFTSAKEFIHLFPEFLDVERAAFFDDDLDTCFKDLVRLFKYDFREPVDLYQAALTSDSFTVWPFLVQNVRKSVVFKTSFVEIMMPFMSQRLLRKCWEDFDTSISGWGLEYGWYSRCADSHLMVVNEVAVAHRKRTDLVSGPFYLHLASLGIDPGIECKQVKSKAIGLAYTEAQVPRMLPLKFRPAFMLLIRTFRTLRQNLGRIRRLVRR